MRGRCLGCNQRIEPAGAVELVKLVIAAHMERADENLRHGHASICARYHLASAHGIPAHVDLGERDPLLRQEPLGSMAIRAIAGGINLDLAHAATKNFTLSIWGRDFPPQPARKRARRRIERLPATMPGRRRRWWRLRSAHHPPARVCGSSPRPCLPAAPEMLPARSGRGRFYQVPPAAASP